MAKRLAVSVGIMAHNEGQNIEQALHSLLSQKLKHTQIREIIIVSSGSTDDTNSKVKRLAKKNQRIKLVTQRTRQGKSMAVNIFLSKAQSDLIVLMSADLLLETNTLEYLVSPLKNASVGIVGAHPIPINSSQSFMGFSAHLLWSLHHQISLQKPKMGEMIAFRKIFKQIPTLSAVDEANIEPLIRGQGYKAVYAPQAIVYNKGPENLEEFIAVRRRVYAGHMAAKYEYSYEVSTFNNFSILMLLIKTMPVSFRSLFWAPIVVILEAYCRLLGFLDYKYKLKNHTVWQINPSTKLLK